MAVFTSQSNSIPILSAVTSPFRACLSLSAPAPASVDRHPPQRAIQTGMEGGRSSDHHRTDKESPLTFPEASVAAVLFRTARQEGSSPHATIQFIEKRDMRRGDEPGSLKGGLCQIRIHLADQSVPPPPPKGRRESYEEDGRDDGMMGMSRRISYSTMASLGSLGGGSSTTRVHGLLGVYSSSLQPGKVRRSLQVLGFKTTETSPGRKTRLVSKLWEVSRAHGRYLTHQTDGRDLLIVEDWEEYQKKKKTCGIKERISRQTDRLCMACEGRHIRVCVRERERMRSR